MKLKTTSTSNKDSQFLELRSFQVEEDGRRFLVPLDLIGLTEKTSSWGTGFEQRMIAFQQFCMLDWWLTWETTTNMSLLSGPADRDVFMEHVIEGMLRADLKTQSESYALYVQNTIMSPNDVRKKMNLPPRKGGDVYENPNTKSAPAADANPPVPPLAFPSDAPQRAWMKKMRAAKRAVDQRKAI